MANALDKNPLYLDTAGATSAITNPLVIQGILVTPTAATWVALLHDADGGDVIFDGQGSAADPIYIPFTALAKFRVSGLYFTTRTNCRVSVYLA